MFFQKNKKQKGLTLIELLAVIAIIAILFVLLIPTISSAFEKARITGVQTDFRSYQTAINSYYFDTHKATKSESELNKYLDKTLSFEGGVSKKKNPWNEPYHLTLVDDKIKITTNNGEKEPTIFYIEFGFDALGEFYEKIVGFDETLKGEVVDWSELTEKEINPSNGLPTGIQPNVTSQDFNLVTNADGTYSIVGYKGKLDTVIIPNTLDGKKVTSIESYAFYPSSVNPSVGKNTGSKIKKIILPEGLETIKAASFTYNDIEHIFIPKTVKDIARVSFAYNNENLKVYIDEENSFYKNGSGNTGIYSKDGKIIYFGNQGVIDTPEYRSIETFFFGSFEGVGLKTVKLPNNNIELIEALFISNPNIKFDIDASHPLYKHGENNIGLYSKDGKKLYYGGKGIESTASYNNVEEIVAYAFFKQNLTNMVVPTNLKIIGIYAFGGNKLEEINLGNTVTTIRYGAFDGNKIRNIVLPNSVQIMGEYVFIGNPLQTYKVSNTTTFPANAFPASAVRVY